MTVPGQFKFTTEESKSLVRFTEILNNVHERVSSEKPTSQILEPRCSVDKLIIHLPMKVSVESLQMKCNERNWKIEGRYKKDQKFYISIYTELLTIDCCVGIPYNTEFKKVELNPSKVDTWSFVERILIYLFGNEVLNSVIYRIDFAFDIFENYQQVLSGLKILYKRANSEFLGDSIRTGLMVGTGTDKVIVYNKGHKEKVEYPWTRIERQLSGRSVFIKRFSEFAKSQDQIIEFDPFKILSLNQIRFNEDHSSSEKIQELKILIKHEGFFLAHKKLNSNRNFARDYGGYFQLIPYSKQPSQYLNEHIVQYLKETIQ